MTKGQQYLIGAVLALFAVVIFIFRGDMFVIPDRPGVSAFLTQTVQPYGLGILVLLFAYLLAKGLNVKSWIFIFLFIIWELIYILMLNFGAGFLPESAKLTGWLGHFKRVALENRSMIQFQEESAQYDKELFYTLRPGTSAFKSFEFDTQYAVNSLGVRDSEENMGFPEVLFLGDSFTMGWGVEEEESFPRIFAKQSGLKTLNTGISSYGTAREYRTMNRVQTDSLKAIIIQYHDTDLEENNYYLKNGRLGSRTQEDFDYQVEDNKKFTTYFPFKYVKTALLNGVRTMQTKGEKGGAEDALVGKYKDFPEYDSEFYQILAKIREIKDVPVIITYTGSFYTEPKVIEAFESYAKKHGVENVYFVNLGDVFTHEDYFYFDDHVNARGHAKIAGALVKKLSTVPGFTK